MPVQKQKSALFQKYGAKIDTAARKHATDNTRSGFIQLPPGINGVARLQTCKFDTYKEGTYKGEYYFQARGVIVEPEYAADQNGQQMKVVGKQTMIQEPVCDTKNMEGKITTQDQHIDAILNHMRLLGGNEFTANATGADLEAMAATLEEVAPFFRFTTSLGRASIDPKTKQPRTPRVWENWHGTEGLENYQPERKSPVTDNTVAQSNGEPPDNSDPVATEMEPADHMSALAEAADGGDGEAATAIQEKALEVGVSQDAIDGAKNWTEVAELISQTGGEPTELQDASPPWAPIKGGTCLYRPVNAKTNKPVKKAVQCEILAVDKKAGTVQLRSLEDSKVGWKCVKINQIAEDA